ncbi:hypothetical protein ABM36_004431 [Salmonella enterica subsp. enterica serovar Adelaide]|nr:hypothetical protein [Salmonella enterica subsp. enterica serovar Adelaide]HAF8819525.1 hypothetical protein [Salmonella enterica]
MLIFQVLRRVLCLQKKKINPCNQVYLPHCIKEFISWLEYPVCVRRGDGVFVGKNSAFEKIINPQAEWFHFLDIDVQLAFLKAEIESCSTFNHICVIENVALSDTHWRIYIEYVLVGNENYFVWRFIDLFYTKTRIISRSCPEDKLLNTIILTDKYNDITPYLIGLSHDFSADLMSIKPLSSRKKVMNFFKNTSYYDRDRFLYDFLISGKINILYRKFLKLINK